MGWRVPSISELQSLTDLSAASSGMVLPIGHPFLNISAGEYWSATTLPEETTLAYVHSFSARGSRVLQLKSAKASAWCVRGPGGW